MCAICNPASDGAKIPSPDGRAFECMAHGAYVVATSAYFRFCNANRSLKESALEKAKAFAPVRSGHVVITTMDL